MKTQPIPQTALMYETRVTADGRLDLPVPLPAGSRVAVFIVQHPEEDLSALVAASASSLDFWDDPVDDEDWNVA